MFEWDPRTGRVLASVWLVEEEVADAMRRLRSHFPVVGMWFVSWVIGSGFFWFSLPFDPRLKVVFLILWFPVCFWFASGVWEHNIANAVRTWRETFRGRVKEFGMESLDAPEDDMIRVVCTRARYTKVAPDGSLTDELDDAPSWGYWVPGLGYMGWGHASADDAREAAVRRITSQLTVNRGDSRSVPMAVDIREQRETWLKAELWSKETTEARPQNGTPPRRR